MTRLSPETIRIAGELENMKGRFLQKAVSKCLASRMRRIGMRLQPADVEDIQQDALLRVLTAFRNGDFRTADSIRSLIWLTCRRSIATWLEDRKPLHELSEDLDTITDRIDQAETTPEHLPTYIYSLLGYDIRLSAVANALSRCDVPAAAESLGLSERTVQRKKQDLRILLEPVAP